MRKGGSEIKKRWEKETVRKDVTEADDVFATLFSKGKAESLALALPKADSTSFQRRVYLISVIDGKDNAAVQMMERTWA